MTPNEPSETLMQSSVITKQQSASLEIVLYMLQLRPLGAKVWQPHGFGVAGRHCIQGTFESSEVCNN